jgi:hypothetical protein
MVHKKKKYIITNLDILQIHKRANRNNITKIKPTISKDKKKHFNKYLCRNKNIF